MQLGASRWCELVWSESTGCSLAERSRTLRVVCVVCHHCPLHPNAGASSFGRTLAMLGTLDGVEGDKSEILGDKHLGVEPEHQFACSR